MSMSRSERVRFHTPEPDPPVPPPKEPPTPGPVPERDPPEPGHPPIGDPPSIPPDVAQMYCSYEQGCRGRRVYRLQI